MKFNDLADLELIKDVFTETDLVSQEVDNQQKNLLVDKEMTCIDCDKKFTFTVEEQQFYKERHLSEPKRCKECAKARRKFFRHKGDK